MARSKKNKSKTETPNHPTTTTTTTTSDMKRRGGGDVDGVRHTPIPVTHSGLQLFDAPRVLTPSDRGYTE